MEYKRAQYIERLKAKKHNGLIKIITGMRRSGKSYLLFKLFKQELIRDGVLPEQIMAIAIDDYANKSLRNPDALYAAVRDWAVGDQDRYLLIDEVQLIEDFESILNGFLHIPNLDIYVTGSNAKFLSKDIITEFRGRGDEIYLLPLSFSEFMEGFPGPPIDGWNEYVQFGGLPLVVQQSGPEAKSSLLKTLITETYLNDILSRHRIKNKQEFETLFNLLASGIGSLTNPKKLSDSFKTIQNTTISENTIKNYIDYLSDAFLISEAMRYDIKGKRYISAPLKYFFTDMGIRNARLNFRQLEESHAMENILYIDLIRRGFNVDVGIVTQNLKSSQGESMRKQFEVDFVCNQGYRRYYIQSALRMPDEDKLRQEQASLLQIGDGFKKIIICKDGCRTHYTDQGILILNLFDFLMHEDSLKE